MNKNTAQDLGYIGYREFDNGRNAAVMPLLFTWAIVADLTDTGYEDRWCYHDLCSALGALEDWNGRDEPQGWHRHPLSGRRRDELGVEHVAL